MTTWPDGQACAKEGATQPGTGARGRERPPLPLAYSGARPARVITRNRLMTRDTRHDTLFAQVFGEPRCAAAHLADFLPPRIRAELVLEQLTHLPEALAARRAGNTRHLDLAFSAPLRHQGGVAYLLFEHKADHEPLLPVKLLHYMSLLWLRHRRHSRSKAARALPPILPLLLYHGRRPLPHRNVLRIEELLTGPPALLQGQPRFRAIV
jgi:hypothetical protein